MKGKRMDLNSKDAIIIQPHVLVTLTRMRREQQNRIEKWMDLKNI